MASLAHRNLYGKNTEIQPRLRAARRVESATAPMKKDEGGVETGKLDEALKAAPQVIERMLQAQMRGSDGTDLGPSFGKEDR